MNVSRFASVMSAAFALGLCIILFSTRFGVAATIATEEPSAMVSVQYIGVNPAVESIDADTPFIHGDVAKSLSSAKLGGDPASENAFLLRTKKSLKLEFVMVEGFSQQGQPIPGDLLDSVTLEKGVVYLFRHHVPEGMPNLLVCAKDEIARLCWTPRFSGVDGSVELDPGFVLFKTN